MPSCYLLAVAQGSALDQYTNTFTLFSLVDETLGMTTDQPLPAESAVFAPFEVHVYWYLSPEEFGIEFEWRLIFVTPEGDIPGEDIHILKSDTMRHRIRVRGIPILATGRVVLRVEWRKKGARKWNRCDVFWPLEIELTSVNNLPQR